MCGIAGWIELSPSSPGIARLKAMTDTLPHRGPDGDGHYLTQTRDGKWSVALGHRRLAIIDLAGGVQPMHSDDERLAMVYNGEIYNYRTLRDELRAQTGRHFRTDSDSLVLLEAMRAWQPQALDRLRGMFAFAIWDHAEQRMLFARDPFGKKPLYLYQDERRLIFASEIKAILAHPDVPRELDAQSVMDYLTYRYVPAPHTLFKGIRKLMPGCYAVWQDGHLSERRYFTPPDAATRPDAAPLADPVAAFTAKLEEAVALRMVADVPFGAFLSGGLDSSAIVALMSRHSALPVNTFSVGFKEAADYSELPYARQVAEQFNCHHTEIEVSADALMTHLPTLIRHRDAPVAEPSDIPIYLIAKEARKTVKMVLTGEGSDEILGGYPKHRFEPLARRYQSVVPGAVHRRLIEPLIQALPYKYRRHKIAAANFGLTDPQERFPRWMGAQSFAERARLAALDLPPRAPDPYPFAADADQAPLRQLLYFDQTSWLPDNLLERGDRMTMAASIEARMPFMDHELARFVTRLPDEWRIKGKVQKRILRAAMANVLPHDILHRPKVGFRVPVNEWFRTTMRDYVHDHLMGADSLTGGLYRRAELATVLREHSEGRQNHEKLIWMLVNLELFQREYRLSDAGLAEAPSRLVA